MPFKPSNFQTPPPASGELFEDLCLDLYTAEFGIETQKNGRRGQSQNGVDIFAPRQRIGIQCKKRNIKGAIAAQELAAEAKKARRFKPALKRFILAAACQRDAKIQEAAREISEKPEQEGLFSIEIHSWDEIKSLLDKYPKIYDKYYPHPDRASLSAIKALQSESRHQEMNRIRDLLDSKPQTAFDLLEKFEKDKGGQLDDKEKYRLLTNRASALMGMQKPREAAALPIKALQFNREDEGANENCAQAYFITGDIEQAKKHIEKAKRLNPLNITAFNIEIQIKDKEGRPLEDIVSSLPESIRENYRIAFVLAYISIRKKRYAEAQKWLDTAKPQDIADINGKADFADLSLDLILARPDVLSGRRAPDSLKTKLAEIINIYQELAKDRKYSELSACHPEWRLNYALSLELDGQMDKAAQALQNGIERFPKDKRFIERAIRLCPQNSNSITYIKALEKQLGFEFPKDSSNSMNRSALASGRINRIGKLFDQALLLSGLYFSGGQSAKAWRLLEKIIEDPSIDEVDRKEAQKYKASRLISSGKIEAAEEQMEPLAADSPNDVRTLILKSRIEGGREKASASKGKADQAQEHKDKKSEYLKKAYSIFKDTKYEGEGAGQSGLYFKSKERLMNIYHLAEEFYRSKMYAEAEPLLEEITRRNLNHPVIFKLLRSYFENGENRKAVQLAEALLQKFPSHPDPANTLFHLHHELGDAKKAIQYCEIFIQANPEGPQTAAFKLNLAHSYINSGQIGKARALLKEGFDISSLSPDQTGRLALAHAHAGSAKEALEIQYQNIKKHPGKMELESLYFSLFLSLTQKNPEDFEKSAAFQALPPSLKFLNPESAAADCYIKIQNIKSGSEAYIVIEEGADTYTLKHPLSKALLGKKAGDNIEFLEKTYQIRELKSKYAYKFQEIAEKSELRHGLRSFVKSAYVSKKPDMKELSKALRELAPGMAKWKERANQLLQFYKEGRATAGAIAKAICRHPLEVMGYFISSDKDKWISALPGRERCEEATAHLENSSGLLLDLFSLAALHQIEMEKFIEKSSFDLYICQSTIDSLKDFIDTMAPHAKGGLFTASFDGVGELRRHFAPAENMRQKLNFWIKAKKWAEKSCRIKPISSDVVLRRQQRRVWERVIGKEFLDPLLALYNDPGIALLSEDAALRELMSSVHQEIGASQGRAAPLRPRSLRLFDLIEHLKGKAVIESMQAIQFKAGLIKLNQTYIPINHEILIFLLNEAEHSIRAKTFQRGLFFLGPVSKLPGALRSATAFFVELCQDHSLSPYRRQMTINEALDKASFGRYENPGHIADQILHFALREAPLLPLLHRELCGYISEWKKGKIY